MKYFYTNKIGINLYFKIQLKIVNLRKKARFRQYYNGIILHINNIS